MDTINLIEEPAVDMLEDIIYLKIYGVHLEWKTYKFAVDVDSLGCKVSLFLYLKTDK